MRVAGWGWHVDSVETACSGTRRVSIQTRPVRDGLAGAPSVVHLIAGRVSASGGFRSSGVPHRCAPLLPHRSVSLAEPRVTLARAHGSRTHRRGSSPRPPVLKPELRRIAVCSCVQDVRPYAWDKCSSMRQYPVSVGLSASRTASSGGETDGSSCRGRGRRETEPADAGPLARQCLRSDH